MRRSIFLLAVGILLFPENYALAWSRGGHRVIGSIVYQVMTPADRAAVISILEQHPRFQEDFESQIPSGLDADERGEWLFQQASEWPDMARGGPPARQAFHRAHWHFINKPLFLTPDDKDALEDNVDVNLNLVPPSSNFDDQSMNAVQAIKNSTRIFRDSSQPASLRAVHICWMLHLIEDIHQPCHATALFSQFNFPQGDKGGNNVLTVENGNLHKAWDIAFGTSGSLNTSRNTAITLRNTPGMDAVGNTAVTELDPDFWLDETAHISEQEAYSPSVKGFLITLEDNSEAINDNPVPLGVPYLQNLKKICDRQAIKAGYRLAAVLSLNTPQPAPVPVFAGIGAAIPPAGVPGFALAPAAATPNTDEDLEERLKRVEQKLDHALELIEKMSAHFSDE